MEQSSAEAIAARFRSFAEDECHDYAPLYARLARHAAADDELIDFVAAMPDRQPNLLFNAIQHIAGPAAMPQDGAGLRAVVRQRGADIARIMRTRHTQTNEVGRCTALLPALPAGPLALLEVGASAGLCLLLDRYRYDYEGRTVGDPASPVLLRCRTTGSPPLPAATPDVVWRRGLDREPIDAADDDSVRWLLSCVWADHPERRARLQAAVDLYRAEPVEVAAGDLVDDLQPLLDDAPADAQLVVFHSAVLAYVEPVRRAAFQERLVAHSRVRDIVWISNESRDVVPDLGAAAAAAGDRQFVLARTRFAAGRIADREVLAHAHPHGWSLDWLAG